MLFGDVAVVFNLLSIGVLAFAVSVIFITIVTSFILERSEQFSFKLRKLILWVQVSAPWWIAFGCLTLFVPEQDDNSSTTWLFDFAHWHHIDVFSFTSWHSFTLFAAFVYLFYRFGSTFKDGLQQSVAISNLIDFTNATPTVTKSQLVYYSLPFKAPAAFTAGLLSPKVYLTTALLDHISQQELDIIVRHELAHVESRDPLNKAIFSALACFFPVVTKRKLIEHFTLLTEQIADYSVTATYDNLDVAQTLVNVARMQRVESEQINRVGCHGIQTSHFGNDQTSVRVQRLLNPVLPSSWLALGISFLMLASVALLTASVVDSLHHIIETFVTH